MGKLDGKITIVTGATSGIGRRTVEIFVQEGAKVLATGRREELGAHARGVARQGQVPVREGRRHAGGRRQGDVRRLPRRKWGRLDCLFNNAGGPAPVGGIETVAGRGLRRGDGDAGALGHAGHEARRADHDEAGLGQHHQQRQRRRPPRRLLDLDDLRRGQGGGEPPHGLRRHAARREERALQLDLAGRHRHRHLRQGAGPGARQGRQLRRGDRRHAWPQLQPIPRAGITDDIANAAVFLASDDRASSTATTWWSMAAWSAAACGRRTRRACKAMRQAFGVDEA